MNEPVSETRFYSLLQRRLHWIVVLLIALQYLFQNLMHEAMLAIEQQQTLSFGQFMVTTLHTWIGVSIGIIMLWRWRLRKRAVPLNGGMMSPQFARWVHAYHICLYLAVMSMVVSGALHYFLLWSPAARWHELGKWLVVLMIAVHILGALTHAVSGNKVLWRMMGVTAKH